MMRPFASVPAGLLLLSAIATPALARETGAHVHGRVEMAVIREGATVTVELRSPLYNLVGFERAPATDAERQTWKAASTTVANPDRLFTLGTAARCALRSSRTGVLGGPPPTETDHDGDDHDHDHEHGADHDSLSDAVLTYVFDCQQAAKLSRISVQAFGAFGRIEAVDLVYLDGSRQTAKKLTPGNAEFRTR